MMSTCCSKHVEASINTLRKSASSWSLRRSVMTCFKLLFPMPASPKENSEKLYRQKFHSPIWSRSAKVSARNSVLEMKSRPILKFGDIIHNFKISHMTIKCYWSVRDSVSFSPFDPQFHVSHLVSQFHVPQLVPEFRVHIFSKFL
jgi:hypothetical protein